MQLVNYTFSLPSITTTDLSESKNVLLICVKRSCSCAVIGRCPPTLSVCAFLWSVGCRRTYQLESLYDRRVKQCNRLFDSISSPGHRLSALLTPKHVSKYNTRKKDVYNIPRMRTDSFRHSFIPAMCECANAQVS